MQVLGVPISECSREDAQQCVRKFLRSCSQHTIFTPNPEMLVDAYSDSFFLHILQTADLSLCDGKGLEFAGLGKLTRISGIDFLYDICAIAAEMHKSVYLLGSGNKKIIMQAEENIKHMYPDLRIAGSNHGISFILDTKKQELLFDASEHNDMLADIIQASPDILLVGLGHNKQERWIYSFLKELPSIQLAMGVGGSFDYISGRIPRAPYWMRCVGVEWLWRLYCEPWRIRRILKAVVVFPCLLLFTKLKLFIKK